MAVVNFKYPDGRTESKNLISAFKKNGTEVVVVDLDFTDNGHKVMGVLHNSDGFYHNIIDQAKWDEIRGLLVESIHGTLTDEDYNVVNEINVSADPYRQLALKDDNFVSLSQNYEAFLSRIKPNEEVNAQNVEQSQPIETPNLENTSVGDLNNPEIVNQPVSEPIVNAEISSAPVNPETPIVEDVNSNNNELNSPVTNEPVNNIDEANTTVTTPNSTNLEQEPVNLMSAPENIVNDNAAMMTNDSAVVNNETMVNAEVNNVITEPEQAEIINNVENGTVVDNQPVSEPVANVEISSAPVNPETPSVENANLSNNELNNPIMNEPINDVNEADTVVATPNPTNLEQEPVNLMDAPENTVINNPEINNNIENGMGMDNQVVSPIVNEPVANEVNPIPMASNMPSLEQEPVNLNSDLLMDNETMQNDLMSQLDTPVNNEPLVTNEPVNNVNEVPTNNNDMSILESSPIVTENVTPDLVTPESIQPIIDNETLNVPPVGPVTNDTEAQQDTISLMDAPIDNPFVLNETPAEPVINNEPVQPEVSANDSIVTNAYMNGFEEIKIAMDQLVQESIERITNIGKEFNEKVDEYASKAKGSLQEASEYGKLLKDRFEATQNNMNNMGINPDMLNTPEENPTLKLAA